MSADRRRSNGEGTEITKDKHGRYHAWLSFGVTTGGLRDRRHVSGASRREVAQKLRALQAKRDAGVVPTAGTASHVAPNWRTRRPSGWRPRCGATLVPVAGKWSPRWHHGPEPRSGPNFFCPPHSGACTWSRLGESNSGQPHYE